MRHCEIAKNIEIFMEREAKRHLHGMLNLNRILGYTVLFQMLVGGCCSKQYGIDFSVHRREFVQIRKIIPHLPRPWMENNIALDHCQLLVLIQCNLTPGQRQRGDSCLPSSNRSTCEKASGQSLLRRHLMTSCIVGSHGLRPCVRQADRPAQAMEFSHSGWSTPWPRYSA